MPYNKKMRSRPYTKQELDAVAKNKCGQYRNRVKKYRADCPATLITSTKTDQWDMPLVVVACGSTKAPFCVKTGRNNSTLRECHPVLVAAYRSFNTEIGEKPPHSERLYPGEDHFDAGHCAEPHAAHALLNEMSDHRVILHISDIVFSSAFRCKNNTTRSYCGTCKLVVLQLR